MNWLNSINGKRVVTIRWVVNTPLTYENSHFNAKLIHKT